MAKLENLTELVGNSLKERLESLSEKGTVAIVEYKDIFREVFLMEVKSGMMWVYQKGDFCAGKKSGLRQMRISELTLWEIVRDGLNIEDWKKELEVFDNELKSLAT